MTGLQAISGITVVALGIALLRRRKRNEPTRPARDMDRDVRERIRQISADSRYSSAGYEF